MPENFQVESGYGPNILKKMLRFKTQITTYITKSSRQKS